MKEAFKTQRFNAKSQKLITQANDIIVEYRRSGLGLTLRQLYYQLVARGNLANEQKNYKRLGSLLSNARLAGLVDWDALEDRTRNLKGFNGSDIDVPSYISGIASGYHVDLWEGQENYIEVWVEKEALAGVVERACGLMACNFFSCRGFNSQSEQYRAGKRFHSKGHYEGRECFVLHLGDHDPSGMDMTRDNIDRLSMFSGGNVTLKRVALNMDQIEELKPPPNPAKETDSRAQGYIKEFGRSSWELDALPPDYIVNLIKGEISKLVDIDQMNSRREHQEEGRREIDLIAENYEEFVDWVNR